MVMVYVADYARKWSTRRRDKAIDRSVDKALAEVARYNRIQRTERREKISQAQTAIAGLPDSHFDELGRKFSISPGVAEGELMRMALTRPELVLRAIQNTMAKLAAKSETE